MRIEPKDYDSYCNLRKINGENSGRCVKTSMVNRYPSKKFYKRNKDYSNHLLVKFLGKEFDYMTRSEKCIKICWSISI